MRNIREAFSEEEVKAMSLGDRMKWYEHASGKMLDGNHPAIIRIDGKAFHTYTRGFDKPFDKHITEAMKYTMVKLCENVQNVRIGYMQSDEISLLMTTHENSEKQPWFGGKTTKVVSIAASMASAYFNEYMDKMYWTPKIMAAEIVGEAPKKKLAIFDARTWNVPMDEVNNVFIWRQQDAIRNSVSALAQSHYSHRQLHGKNVEEMKRMLLEMNINWDNLPVNLKRGFSSIKEMYEKDGAMRGRWISDDDTPNFVEDRDYVSRFVEVPQI